MKRKNLDRDQRVWEEINMSYHFLLDLALILLSIIPVIVFYLLCQKYIIKGVAAGAVKG